MISSKSTQYDHSHNDDDSYRSGVVGSAVHINHLDMSRSSADVEEVVERTGILYLPPSASRISFYSVQDGW